MKILVVDDEELLVKGIRFNLQNEGYEVITGSNGVEALEKAKDESPDLIILDVMMPNMDGLEVCKQLRTRSSNIGIIMLTAKTQEMDKVRGLMLGADDYISKPFSPSELIARVDAIYRRVNLMQRNPNETETIESGPFIFNPKSRILTKNGAPIDLTQVEYQMVELFMKNPNVALERSKILNYVWGKDYVGDVKIVDVNIRRLRMKIEDEPSVPKYIHTIWGFGYKWMDL